jgi:hypothetical protein
MKDIIGVWFLDVDVVISILEELGNNMALALGMAVLLIVM